MIKIDSQPIKIEITLFVCSLVRGNFNDKFTAVVNTFKTVLS